MKKRPQAKQYLDVAQETLNTSPSEMASEIESNSINHLVVLHRVLYNTISKDAALDYLHKHLKEDADLADLGRPLKYQYINLTF